MELTRKALSFRDKVDNLAKHNALKVIAEYSKLTKTIGVTVFDIDFDGQGGMVRIVRPGTRGGTDDLLAVVHIRQDDLIWPSLRINKFRMGDFTSTTNWEERWKR